MSGRTPGGLAMAPCHLSVRWQQHRCEIVDDIELNFEQHDNWRDVQHLDRAPGNDAADDNPVFVSGARQVELGHNLPVPNRRADIRPLKPLLVPGARQLPVDDR